MARSKLPLTIVPNPRIGVLEVRRECVRACSALDRGDAGDDRGIAVQADFLLVVAEHLVTRIPLGDIGNVAFVVGALAMRIGEGERAVEAVAQESGVARLERAA